MKLSDYIVAFLTDRGVTHFFGYQGSMIAHFVDSIKRHPSAQNHSCYNEQGAAFAACGAAKTTGQCAVAYATSGPGAMNLLSGVADAYYDSAPVLFLTGQINTNEYTDYPGLRQQSFQEADIVSMAKGITKYCIRLDRADHIRFVLEKAWYMAEEGRKGPVLIDLPMNLQRADIDPAQLEGFQPETHNRTNPVNRAAEEIATLVNQSKRPIILFGNGINRSQDFRDQVIKGVEALGIPVITSMLGRDILPFDHALNFGFLGAAYGHRYANLLIDQKSDLILSFGCRLCTRQTGMNAGQFAHGAKIVRVELDPVELERKVHADERQYLLDANDMFLAFSKQGITREFSAWRAVCEACKEKLSDFDHTFPASAPNQLLRTLSRDIPPDHAVCCDVGQHQIWTAYSFEVKRGQSLLFSGGHGAMGFGLPAAIGACYATGKQTFALCGDGAFQMNIQELQWVVREGLPIVMFVFNNNSLGLITQLQDSLFPGGGYCGTTAADGFSVPNFQKIALAYGLDAVRVTGQEELSAAMRRIDRDKPYLIEIMLGDKTWAYPKTVFGEPIYNPEPYFPGHEMDELLQL